MILLAWLATWVSLFPSNWEVPIGDDVVRTLCVYAGIEAPLIPEERELLPCLFINVVYIWLKVKFIVNDCEWSVPIPAPSW